MRRSVLHPLALFVRGTTPRTAGARARGQSPARFRARGNDHAHLERTQRGHRKRKNPSRGLPSGVRRIGAIRQPTRAGSRPPVSIRNKTRPPTSTHSAWRWRAASPSSPTAGAAARSRSAGANAAAWRPTAPARTCQRRRRCRRMNGRALRRASSAPCARRSRSSTGRRGDGLSFVFANYSSVMPRGGRASSAHENGGGYCTVRLRGR
jgi:hypothetical protein